MTQAGLQGTFVEEVCAADSGIAISPIPAVNVATVPQRSPLRYPGGKTWLVPHIRAWLAAGVPAPRLLIEPPFAGGGIASLTSVMEGLVDRCLMAEIDPDVAAFWHAALRHGAELSERVTQFTLTRESLKRWPSNIRMTWWTAASVRLSALNRTRRGGILAPGASLARVGENGNGVASRWYPITLVKRLREIARYG